jgi:hypothetical protein
MAQLFADAQLALTALFTLEFVVVSRHFEVAGGGTVLRGSRRGAQAPLITMTGFAHGIVIRSSS